MSCTVYSVYPLFSFNLPASFSLILISWKLKSSLLCLAPKTSISSRVVGLAPVGAPPAGSHPSPSAAPPALHAQGAWFPGVSWLGSLHPRSSSPFSLTVRSSKLWLHFLPASQLEWFCFPLLYIWFYFHHSVPHHLSLVVLVSPSEQEQDLGQGCVLIILFLLIIVQPFIWISWILALQSVVPGPAASEWPVSWLKTHGAVSPTADF